MLNTFIFNLMLQFELADLLFQLLNHCPSNKRWSKMTRWMFCGLTKTLNLLRSQNYPGDTLQYHYCGLHFPWCSRLTLSGPHPPESSAGWSEDWAPARVWPTSPCTHPPTAPTSPCLSTFYSIIDLFVCVSVSCLSSHLHEVIVGAPEDVHLHLQPVDVLTLDPHVHRANVHLGAGHLRLELFVQHLVWCTVGK